MTWRHPSIAARLTLGLGLVALLVFSAAGLLLQTALETELEESDRLKLAGKISAVLHFVDEAARSGDKAALFHHLDDLRIGHDGLYVWLFTASGEHVYGAPSLLAMPSPGRVRLGAPGVEVEVETSGARLPETAPWPSGLLGVGLETGPRLALLRSHLLTLVLVCALGVAFSVLLSWFAIRRCLGPVAKLSSEASAITPRSLGRRLTVPPEGAELNGLVLAFNHVLDRLEEAYEQLQGFNANVAHELRTPLASLVTGTQITLSSSRSREELRETLMSNLEELELLSALVTDMLFLSRADRGDRAEGLERVDLGHEADKAIRYCDAMLQEAGVEARRVGDAPVLCNPPLIRRALVNLLTNAIRHTPAGFAVRIVIDRDGDAVRLAAANTGPEIPETVRSRMFDRFYRADASRTHRGPGHGLGLAIVAAIARMHGGTVFAERVGDENRIGLTLPPPSPAVCDALAETLGSAARGAGVSPQPAPTASPGQLP